MTKHNDLFYEKDRNIDLYKTEENKTPDYYIGNDGLEAIDVVHQFNLSYDLGTACSYILRAKNKHNDEGYECISKAIRHLEYELRKIKKNSTKYYSGGKL